MKLLLIFLGIIIFKSLVNLIRFFLCKHYYNTYIKWLESGEPKNLFQSKNNVIKLIKDSGIEERKLPWAQPVGFGYISTAHVSVIQNFPSRYEEIAIHTGQMFQEAIGVYKTRALEGFNPMFWVETIVFLPKKIVVYLGLKPEKVGVKILQLLWWFFGIGVSVLWTFFREDILLLLENFVKRMLQ